MQLPTANTSERLALGQYLIQQSQKDNITNDTELFQWIKQNLGIHSKLMAKQLVD